MAGRKRSRSTSRRKAVRKTVRRRSKSTSRGKRRRSKSTSRGKKRRRSTSRGRKRSKSTSRRKKRRRSSSRKKKMPAGHGYCVKCKKAHVMAKARTVTMKNGRKALKGQCPKHGTGMYRIL